MPIIDDSWESAKPTAVATPTAQPSNNGGILGGLYNTFIKPTVDTVVGIPADVIGAGKALGITGSSVLRGESGQKLQQSKQSALNALQEIPMLKGTIPTTVKEAQAQPLSKSLEKIAGATGSSALTLAPYAGLGPAVEAGSVGQGILSGAKVGGLYGAAGGVFNTMKQGGSLDEIGNNALSGGALGGLAGGVLGGATGLLGKLTGKVTGATGEQDQNFVDSLATKKAQQAYNKAVQENFGAIGRKAASDNGIGINEVLNDMLPHGIASDGIAPNATDMAQYGNAGTAYHDMIMHAAEQGKPVNLNLEDMVNNAMGTQPAVETRGITGGFADNLKTTLQNALDPQGTVQADVTGSGVYHPADMLKAATDLRNVAVEAGDTPKGKVIDALRKSLIDAAGKQGGVNEAIQSLKLPNVDQVTLGLQGDAESNMQHILDMAGGNKSLAQEMIDNINGAKTVQDLQKAMLPHIAASDIAKQAAESTGELLPKAEQAATGSGNDLLQNTFGAGRPTVASMLAAGAKKVGSGIESGLAKLGTPDTSQLGANIPVVGKEAGTLGQGMQNAASGLSQGGKSSYITDLLTKLSGNAIGNAVSTPSNNQSTQASPTVVPASNTSAVQVPKDTSLSGGADSRYPINNFQADIARDPKNAAVYEGLFKQFNPNYGQATKLSTQAENEISDTKVALNNLDTLETRFAKAGGANPAMALLASNDVTGPWLAADQYAYEHTKYDTAVALAKAMTGGVRGVRVIEAFYNSLPDVKESPASAAAKLDQLRQNLQGKLDTLQGAQ